MDVTNAKKCVMIKIVKISFYFKKMNSTREDV